jgi:hypothetical protein
MPTIQDTPQKDSTIKREIIYTTILTLDDLQREQDNIQKQIDNLTVKLSETQAVMAKAKPI